MATPVQQSISAMETVAFILPGPWGPIASAALHLFGNLFDPEQPDPNKPVLDAIQNGFANLIADSAKTTIQECGNYLDTLDNWIADVQSRTDMDNPVTLSDIISNLGDLDKPITRLDPVLNKLTVSTPSTASNYLSLEQARVTTFVSLRVSIACCLNLRVLLQQQLLNFYNESDYPQDRRQVLTALRSLASYFVSLKVFGLNRMTGKTYVDALKGWCDQIRDTLLGKVSQVQQGGKAPQGPSKSSDRVYYSFTDENGSDHRFTNQYKEDVTATGSIFGASYTYKLLSDEKATADQARASYVKTLTSQCDQFRDEQLSVFLAAQKRLRAVQGGANPPSVKPSVTLVDTGCDGAWVFTKKYVRYAIAFVLPDSYVPDDKHLLYSDWMQCDPRSSYCPVVSLPGDPTGTACGRMIYREVADDNLGTNAEPKVIGIPNLEHTEFTDLEPANQTDVCPNVLSAPILWADNYVAKQPGRTWPNPYRVRYRYRLSKKIKGQNYVSPTWSPWSVPRPLAGLDIDNEGFLYSPNYYSAQMTVKNPDDDSCTFLLQRHFKGNPIPKDNETIACRVVKTKNTAALYLCDDAGP